MADIKQAKLDAVPDVEIDPSGRFKYVLIKLYVDDGAPDEKFKFIVRGNARGEYHGEILDVINFRIMDRIL